MIIGDHEVPAKCVDCAEQCDLSLDYDMAQRKLASVLRIGGFFVGEEGQRMDDMMRQIRIEDVEGLPEISEDALQSALPEMRKMLGSAIDEIAEEPDGIIERSQELSRVCRGVLKLRASKEDHTYTVSICTSEALYEEGPTKKAHVATHVRRSPAS